MREMNKADETLAIAHRLYDKEMDLVGDMNSHNYKWEIGILAVRELERTFCGPVGYPFKAKATAGETVTMYGMPVDICYEDPYRVKLWKEVTL